MQTKKEVDNSFFLRAIVAGFYTMCDEDTWEAPVITVFAHKIQLTERSRKESKNIIVNKKIKKDGGHIWQEYVLNTIDVFIYASYCYLQTSSEKTR